MALTASGTGTSIASLGGFLVVTLAEIIGAGMDNDSALSDESATILSPKMGILSYANDALGTNELDVLVAHGTLGIALAIGLDVAQVTDVTGLVGGSTVRLSVGVDC